MYLDRGTKAKLPAPVRGLRFEQGASSHRQFLKRFAGIDGTLRGGANDEMCLCGFFDWDALHSMVRDAMTINGISWAAASYVSSDYRPVRFRLALLPPGSKTRPADAFLLRSSKAIRGRPTATR